MKYLHTQTPEGRRILRPETELKSIYTNINQFGHKEVLAAVGGKPANQPVLLHIGDDCEEYMDWLCDNLEVLDYDKRNDIVLTVRHGDKLNETNNSANIGLVDTDRGESEGD